MQPFDKVKQFLDDLEQKDIRFKEHFYDKTKERPISEGMIRENLKKTNNLLSVEEQPARRNNEEKYKLWIKLSNKYSLVIVVTISGKALNIVTAWNTDRKWQNQIQK